VTNRLDLPEVTWRRVSPKLIAVELVGTAILGIIVVAATVPFILMDQVWARWLCGIIVVVILVTLVVTPRRVRAIGYQLREDDLLCRRGILFQRFIAVPYGRMQLVDINRGPLSRLLGLSELKLVTAAAASGVTIPGLPVADADELRDRLVALAETRRAGL
jgi:membrane protein YdbS with pleckstrin-like domain